MLFNSYDFIFFFLPVVVAGFLILSQTKLKGATTLWLVACSFYFYMDWDLKGGFLLAGSILVNYVISLAIKDIEKKLITGLLFISGIVFNLSLLGYFKYHDFFVSNINNIAGTEFTLLHLVLPIGISFFTFQQIAYLMDVRRGVIVDRNFFRYALFVSFFPQLIAGPIVHHKEMMPQFGQAKNTRIVENLAIGLAIFVIGLSKKVLIADQVAQYSTPVFTAVARGEVPGLMEAWLAALAYTLQIYFDFSGYSDMAIGAARMMGITLPINFSSPYKSKSIIEFWRRWHITLSRFLRDYLYFSLGGNKKGKSRRYTNLLITMLLGGFWHGAGWTFVVWGAMHGLYLSINHFWIEKFPERRLPLHIGPLLTFLAVVFAWVVFRADSMDTTLTLWQSMIGLNGLSADAFAQIVKPANGYPLVLALLLLCFLAPNTQQIMRNTKPGLHSPGYEDIDPAKRWMKAWSPAKRWSILVGIVFSACLLSLGNVSEFIYFQF